MIPVAAAAPHTDAVVALIEATTAVNAAQLKVGRGGQPAGSGWQGEPDASTFINYVVLFPTPGTVDGPVAEPTEYLDYTVQATVVAASQQGVEVATDLVKTALVNVELDVSGRASYPGQLLVDRPATRDDTVAPPLHYSVLQLRWRTQPA